MQVENILPICNSFYISSKECISYKNNLVVWQGNIVIGISWNIIGIVITLQIVSLYICQYIYKYQIIQHCFPKLRVYYLDAEHRPNFLWFKHSIFTFYYNNIYRELKYKITFTDSLKIKEYNYNNYMLSHEIQLSIHHIPLRMKKGW